jgi:hypothetical protein
VIRRLGPAALASLVLGGGCFYTEQINQRPSIDIRQTSDEDVFRGMDVTLHAVSHDPEGHVIFYSWRMYACTDVEILPSGERPGCDDGPFNTESVQDTTFKVPLLRVDEQVPVEAVLVILEAQDDYGAIARPSQQLVIPISNHAPSLRLSMKARHEFIEQQDIDLSVEVGDEDDGAENVTLDWKVYTPPNQPDYDFVDLPIEDPDAPKLLQFGKTITPRGIGDWEVEVTATDPLGGTMKMSFKFKVEPDRPPCLTQWAPIAAPAGTQWPMTDPTLFQVTFVYDALDPYPAIPGDAALGTASFAWSIKQPGASTRTDLGVTTNSVALDPAAYAPGDVIELRVEVQDRNMLSPSAMCADANLTCSVISDNTCIQRLTWTVKVQ